MREGERLDSVVVSTHCVSDLSSPFSPLRLILSSVHSVLQYSSSSHFVRSFRSASTSVTLPDQQALCPAASAPTPPSAIILWCWFHVVSAAYDNHERSHFYKSP
ncbi:hypothetical protein Q1695_009698 [Nippostrongylus brasiliensis]|nr:hypothetical protein Q1695_009698 [Nippostrongylus brasiliensis]